MIDIRIIKGRYESVVSAISDKGMDWLREHVGEVPTVRIQNDYIEDFKEGLVGLEVEEK